MKSRMVKLMPLTVAQRTVGWGKAGNLICLSDGRRPGPHRGPLGLRVPALRASLL